MDVVRHAADALGKGSETFDDSTQISVEFVPPTGVDCRFPVFGGEDQMIMQRGMGRWHGMCPLVLSVDVMGCG
jgi:hypothetical protein